MAQCVAHQCELWKIPLQVSPKLKDLLRMGFGQQSIRHPPLVPEFKEFVFPEIPSSDSSRKLIIAPPLTGELSEQSPEKELHYPAHEFEVDHGVKRRRRTFKYGVWRSPQEFKGGGCVPSSGQSRIFAPGHCGCNTTCCVDRPDNFDQTEAFDNFQLEEVVAGAAKQGERA